MRPKHRIGLLLVMVGLLFGLTGCGKADMSVLDPAGPVAKMELSVIMTSVYIMTGVFIVAMAILVYVLIRFRRRKGQDLPPKQVEGNNWLELTWTVIPLILMGILAVPTVTTAFALDQKQTGPNTMNVTVKASQFWWQFEYPDLGIVTAQALHIPVGTKVNLKLETTDVMHSFWVPRLAGKTDLVPGRVNTMWFEASQPGEYQGKCAEYCGPSHGVMDFVVIADTPQQFQAWVERMKNPQVQPTSALAAEGEKLFAQNCATCHAVAGTNFKGILGPDLTDFADRPKVAGVLDNTPADVEKWISDPAAIKPGTKMPKLPLNQQQVSALAVFLEGLK
ncbi:cytochrome c oxidase subunit II [Kyrpidia tusciae]|uniref:Cytochrome c oxidase subunit 2 n=1 Tax=Kyrpidia tusciae (strain DSM 2912 / NBRC 15312 / T2) TaxID=562970 RepID=D5WT96_KYRT2|nr:cytochrome c oxidase subunit II [Kyrpidia tusciae]ADG05200.1 cytochrome c oxidase, subunit II [Kyrpidia tusciae DSM 2912]